MRLALITTLAIVLGIANARADEPKFQIKIDPNRIPKYRDSITYINKGSRTEFVVTSNFGIGGAQITLAKSKWPKDVTLWFRYEAGRGFKMLESFSIATSRLRAHGSSNQSGKARFYFADDKGKFSHSTGPPAGYLDIKIQDKKGAMQVVLPS